MSESAEALAANLKSRRNVTIEINNLSNNCCLLDPRVYLDSGNCHSPPQPIVRPMKIEVCNFSKGGGKATGAVGLLAYDMLMKGQKVAQETLVIMYSVPYDNNVYKNWFALGMFPKDREIDEKLYKEMYYNKEQVGFQRAECNGCCLSYQGSSFDVMATMSPLGRAIMKVELWDKGIFSPPMSQGPY